MAEGVKVATLGGGEVEITGEELRDLGNRLRGRVVTPADADYHQVRRVWNGMVDKRPALIVRCRGVADVKAAVDFARERGLLTAVRGGGHNVAGRAVVNQGLVIDLSDMRGVYLDPAGRVLRAEAGATLGDVDHETAPFGLALAMGVVAETGLAGLTLHGGYGWLSRAHGLAVDNLISAQVVTADGRVLNAGARDHADLFWALKGGGGNFGVVTSLEYHVHPVPDTNWVALVMYDLAEAWPVLRGLQDYMRDAPRELAVLASFWAVPEHPDVPKNLWGKDTLWVAGVFHGRPELGEEAVRPLKELGTAMADLSHTTDWLGVQSLFDGEYPDGRRYYWKATYADGLTQEMVNYLAAVTPQRPSPLSSLDVWFLGGKMADMHPASTAFAQRAKPNLLALESNWDDPSADRTNILWTREVFGRLRDMAGAGAYLNFPGFGEEGEELLKAAYARNLARLKEIKKIYDPGNFFQGNFNIAPA
ncbi:MAG: FAD-binding oxidoreductase [Deltaproteobacteria bacterium]|nr:FAD-binding oxidoreductase [Deltaproteobacteria bacterium]